MFLSSPVGGQVYAAERPKRSVGRVNGLAWSRITVNSTSGFVRIPPRMVPKAVRRQAYRQTYRTKTRQ
jgi:hypothetical protein